MTRPRGTTGTRKRTSADWAGRFLKELSRRADIRASCRAAGVGRSTVYRRRDSDPQFAEAMGDAIAEAVDDLEAEAWKRAMDHSDRLLICLLQRHRPEKFGHPGRHDHRHQVEQPVTTEIVQYVVHTREQAQAAMRLVSQVEQGVDLTRLSDDDLRQLERIAGAARPQADTPPPALTLVR